MTRPTIDRVASALQTDAHGISCLPSLIRGELIVPDRPSLADITAAFATAPPGTRVVPLADCQVVAEAELAPTGAPTGRSLYRALPRPPPASLISDDPDALTADLAALPFADVLNVVEGLSHALGRDDGAVGHWRSVTEQHGSADPLANVLHGAFSAMLDPAAIGDAVDRELGRIGLPGRAFLDGWVDVHTDATDGALLRLTEQPPAQTSPAVRAFPTRQVHITAGNAPTVPLVSTLRALATKGAAVIKSPLACLDATTLLALAAYDLDTDHQLLRHLSLVYWKGGDPDYEELLLTDRATDRVVVWGDSSTIESVTARVRGARTVAFKPRFGVSMIGRSGLDDLERCAELVVLDALLGNQRACTSSLVVYVEADAAQCRQFCAVLRDELAKWDERLPHRIGEASMTGLRRLQRGSLARSEWLENGEWPHLSSTVVLADQPFDVSQHPQSRCIVVRPVESLDDAVTLSHAAISTIGVYPEAQRLEVRDRLAMRGVSNIVPLGAADRAYPGRPHDGLEALAELVTWVNG